MNRYYNVVDMWIDSGALIECNDCAWNGRAEDALPIVSCVLTPGDPSPAGRCPMCESLAYIVKEVTQ